MKKKKFDIVKSTKFHGLAYCSTLEALEKTNFTLGFLCVSVELVLAFSIRIIHPLEIMVATIFLSFFPIDKWHTPNGSWIYNLPFRSIVNKKVPLNLNGANHIICTWICHITHTSYMILYSHYQTHLSTQKRFCLGGGWWGNGAYKIESRCWLN